MLVVKKMNALGLKTLHGRVEALKRGTRLETVYRWRAKLSAGTGVTDDIKKALIAATADTDHAIHWSDFTPATQKAAA